MLEISNYLHTATALLVAVALVATLAGFIFTGRGARSDAALREPAMAGSVGGPPDPAGTDGRTRTAPRDSIPQRSPRGPAWFGDRFTELAFVTLTISLVLRALVTGHAPFSNQFEFATAFVWGVLAIYIWFEWRYQIRGLGLLVLPFALAMMIYAANLDRAVDPLIPALQNSWLLTLHVFAAVVGYGAAAVSVAAAALYLLKPHIRWAGLPPSEVLEEIGYRSVVLAFPMLSIMLILGALWADIAWGRYWSWDPKETAALVTWLIYGAYLHARVVAGWRGKKAAWLLVLGFVAIIFTFTGNHWFGGLHSYG